MGGGDAGRRGKLVRGLTTNRRHVHIRKQASHIGLPLRSAPTSAQIQCRNVISLYSLFAPPSLLVQQITDPSALLELLRLRSQSESRCWLARSSDVAQGRPQFLRTQVSRRASLSDLNRAHVLRVPTAKDSHMSEADRGHTTHPDRQCVSSGAQYPFPYPVYDANVARDATSNLEL